MTTDAIATRLANLSRAVSSGAGNPALIRRAGRLADEMADRAPDLADRLRVALTRRWESLGNRAERVDAIRREWLALPVDVPRDVLVRSEDQQEPTEESTVTITMNRKPTKVDLLLRRKGTWEMTAEELARVVAAHHGWEGREGGWIYDGDRPIVQGYSKLGDVLVARGWIKVGTGILWNRHGSGRAPTVVRRREPVRYFGSLTR